MVEDTLAPENQTHVLTSIRIIRRLEVVGRLLRHTLYVLAQAVPKWRYTRLSAAWFERYGTRFADCRLTKGVADRRELAETIDNDGYGLLTAVTSTAAPAWIGELSVVQLLCRIRRRLCTGIPERVAIA